MADDLVMILGGDVHVQRPDPESMFAHVAPTLREANIVFGNLEGVISEPVPARLGNGHLRSDPAMLAAYKSAGFSILGVGNHGSTCCGAETLVRCLDLLDREGIAHAGGGRNRAEARLPGIVERKGTRVAFLAYSALSDKQFHAGEESPGVAAVRAHTSYEFSSASPGFIPTVHTRTYPEDLAMVIEDVERAKAEADVLVATWHWGLGPRSNASLAGTVADYQTELAHAAIDHGCDVVIGHHPHVLGAVEVYRGRPIFYTLGNFAFDYLADPAHAALTYHGVVPHMRRRSFGLARCVISGRRLSEVSLLPLRIPNEDKRPALLDTTAGRDIVDLAHDVSEDYGTQFQVRKQDLLVLGAGSTPAAASR